jgi:hypothetical protein
MTLRSRPADTAFDDVTSVTLEPIFTPLHDPLLRLFSSSLPLAGQLGYRTDLMATSLPMSPLQCA